LKRNSSVRQAIQFARDQGAELILMDDYWPGAEFYFDGPIWYVNAKDLTQAEVVMGQNRERHFLEKTEVTTRQESIDANVWLIQFREKPLRWEQRLTSEAAREHLRRSKVGAFQVWEIRKHSKERESAL
jgi:hypothetical protein